MRRSLGEGGRNAEGISAGRSQGGDDFVGNVARGPIIGIDLKRSTGAVNRFPLVQQRLDFVSGRRD